MFVQRLSKSAAYNDLWLVSLRIERTTECTKSDAENETTKQGEVFLLKKIDIHSRWDSSILLLTFVLALLLIFQKLSFVSSMWLFDPHWSDIAEVLRANILVYVAILLWVWILLRGQHNSWFLRAYVIFAGFVFVTLTRMIEATEEVTRQGVDFAITRHFFLAVFGRGGFAEFFIEAFFR